MEIMEENLKFVPLIDGSQGTEGECICLDENAAEITNQEPGVDEPVELSSILMNESVDFCPKLKPVRSFYFVKCELYESPELNSQIDQAQKEIQQNNQAWLQLIKAIKTKEAAKDQLMALLDLLNVREEVLWDMEHEKRWVDHLDQAMVKLHKKIYTRPEKGSACSSEEELDNLICSLHYLMQHGKRTLVEVKQLHKEIKQLEETREKVRANDIEMSHDFCQQRDEIYKTFKFGLVTRFRYQVMYMGLDLDTIRKKKQLLGRRIEYARKLERSIDDEIDPLRAQVAQSELKKIAACERLLELKRLRDDRNVSYYKFHRLLNNARALATIYDVAALEKLSSSQVEKFMSLWKRNKSFMDDYVQRILPSHDRPLGRDVQMKNPNYTFSILERKNQESETDKAKFMEEIRREDELFQAKLNLQLKKQVVDKSSRKKISWYQNVAEEKLREYEKNLEEKNNKKKKKKRGDRVHYSVCLTRK
ncbi:proton pump-interactor BIP131-like [Papaver somniferum]|uniref:proton pump-interactor BIP131-like n=1 Tax=Papaver somniferum TaxID=3469 RepID=UPI000E705C71|nr:proton pump-interactor BIP131-like [Papaver somniferum]